MAKTRNPKTNNRVGELKLVKSVIRNNFTCQYCQKEFVREVNFLKHKCKEMKRSGQLATNLGQSALYFYQTWMKLSHKNIPTPEVFLSSRYFISFINFAKYAQSGIIANIDIFINLMVDKDIPPTIWKNDHVFALYLEHVERKLTPTQQAEICIDTLFKEAESLNIDISKIFSALSANDICQLLREQKLTPWILLLSDKFKILMQRSTPEQRKILQSLIRPGYWMYKFNKHPQVVQEMKQYVREIEL